MPWVVNWNDYIGVCTVPYDTVSFEIHKMINTTTLLITFSKCFLFYCFLHFFSWLHCCYLFMLHFWLLVVLHNQKFQYSYADSLQQEVPQLACTYVWSLNIINPPIINLMRIVTYTTLDFVPCCLFHNNLAINNTTTL